MAKPTLLDPFHLDLDRPVPEDFEELAKAVREMKEGVTRGNKKAYWNIGRYVSVFLNKDAAHKERYGAHTIEHLEQKTGVHSTQLYDYARIYESYQDEKSLERVCSRDKVAPIHLVALARLNTDSERDQLERHIVEQDLNKSQVSTLVRRQLGKGKRKRTPSDKTDKKTREVPLEAIWTEADEAGQHFIGSVISKTAAQGLASLRKHDPEELPPGTLKAFKAHVKHHEKLCATYAKYLEKANQYLG